MQNRIWCLAFALTIALGLAWWGTAQEPPDKKEGPPAAANDRGDRRGGFGRGGFGPGAAGRDGPRARFAPGGAERAVEELNLTGQKKEKAEAAVKAYQENVRKLMDLARADLQLKMQDVLGEQEYKKFNEALARRPAPTAGRGGPGGRLRGGRGLSVDQIVERIMSFDKNGDGKVTKEELPERMQHLIEKGDTNKDGALDKEEIKKLAAELARDGSFRGLDGRGRPGDGFGPGPGGRGRPGLAGGPPPGAGIERALDELKLPGPQKDKADAAVRAHQENVRRLMDVARADLLLKLKEVLGGEEFKTSKAALDRGPGFGFGFPGGDGRPPRGGPPAGARSGDLEKKLDQLQKELEDLRREIRR